MCKFLVQNFIIKDILKKKNVVHWISVRTIVSGYFKYTDEESLNSMLEAIALEPRFKSLPFHSKKEQSLFVVD